MQDLSLGLLPSWVMQAQLLRCMGFAAPWHVGSQLPDWGSNLCPLQRKVNSQPLDHQGSPCLGLSYFMLGSWHWLSSQSPPPTCLSGPSKTQIQAGMVWAYLVLLYFVHTFLFSPQIESFWQPCIEQFSQHCFPNSICSLPVSVSHFGNSCIISNPPPAKKHCGSLKVQMMVIIF